MCTISADPVLHSRKFRVCSVCGKLIAIRKPYVSVFGSADSSEKPYRVWLCLICATRAGGLQIPLAAKIARTRSAYCDAG